MRKLIRVAALLAALFGAIVSNAQSTPKVPGFDPTPGPGLTVNIAPGKIFCNGSQVNYSGGSVGLNDNATNNIALDTTNSCTFIVETGAFAATDIPIATVTTAGGFITGFADARPRFWTANGGGSGSSLTPLGYIVNASNFTSLSSFTNTTSLTKYSFTSNGATATFSSGAMNLSGAASDYTHTIDYGWVTQAPLSTPCTVATIGSASDSWGVGWRSTQSSAKYGLVGSFNKSTGQVSIATINGTTGNVLVSGGSITANVGDSVQLCTDRHWDTFTVTATNLTTKAPSATVKTQLGFNYVQSNFLPNVSKFSIFLFGGTPSVTSFSVYSQTPVGVNVATLMDSKGAYYAGSYAAAFPSLLSQVMSVVNLMGGSDQTPDMLANLPEVLALKPKAAIIGVYRNDICGAGGISLATTETNVQSAYTQLQAAGITPYVLIGMYEPVGSCNQTSFWTWAQSQFPSTNLLASNMLQESATASNILATDNIHPNTKGQLLTYQGVLVGLPYELFQSYSAWVAAQNASGANNASYGQVDVGGNSNPQGLMTVGVTCAGNPTNPFNVCINQSMTGGNDVVAAAFLTNDSVNPQGLLFAYTGASPIASRIWYVQPQSMGNVNDGTFWLNKQGGQIVTGQIVAGVSQTAVASASTIAPTKQYFHITGTTAINTITAPQQCTTFSSTMCQITAVPDAAFTTTTSGNIAVASTAVVGKALTWTYDPGTSKWYPSY